jgi:MFS family permease
MSEASERSPSQYFKLVEVVGTRGRYQTLLTILACLLCFQNGFLSLGTPYYFAVAPYTNCPGHAGITECTRYACSRPLEERPSYEQPQIRGLSTLGNQFGDYHCDGRDAVEAATGVYYFGGIVGVVVSSPMADNFGRRPTLLVSLALGVVGHLIVQVAGSLGVAGLGMFLAGSCVESCYNLMVCFLSEVLDNRDRQTKTTLMQGFFCFAGIVVIGAFFLFRAWRITFIVFCLLPLAASLLFAYFFVQETPQYLIKRHSVEHIRRSLRFMAKVNGRLGEFEESDRVSEASLGELKKAYESELRRSEKSAFTYWDLLRYRSLRRVTLLMMLLFVSVNILYYAPAMLIDQFGFDFYLNGLILNLSELGTYFLSYFTVTRLPRRTFNILGSGVALAASFALIFLHTKEICSEDCWNPRDVLELVVIFAMRFFVSFVFQVLFVYITELYPIQVVGLAIGLTGTAGAIPVMFIPELINLIDRSGFPVMALFCIVASLYMLASFFLRETRGEKPV